ncbi:hypothetical protein [Caulobacter sp. UNC279MFTsu5.1]|nr:hypothetical protein [Caulobacter sp. UNC279MFTsu5.1]SFI91338.1 hypothetical protein SAMN02799626_00757 [Caulobacter sp. UNC279MFTsu5.1]
MKLLLISGVAVLTFLFASVDKLSAPTSNAAPAWDATTPIHSPR